MITSACFARCIQQFEVGTWGAGGAAPGGHHSFNSSSATSLLLRGNVSLRAARCFHHYMVLSSANACQI